MPKIKPVIKIITGALIIAAAFGGVGYYYANYKSTPNDGPKELQQVIDDVSELMVLPADEVPTLATVTDTKKLEGQPFFANAKIGDKILIYTNLKKVILYSPTMNKIVEVGGINLNGGAQQ